MFAMEADQSMSDFSVKSWSGTHFHLSGVLACVLFKMPNIALANLEYMYLIKFFAFSHFENFPMLKKFLLSQFLVFSIIGIDIVSPKSPFPVAQAKKHLICIKIANIISHILFLIYLYILSFDSLPNIFK